MKTNTSKEIEEPKKEVYCFIDQENRFDIF